MSTKQEYFVKIAKNRIAVLIGPNGETKSYIEKNTNSKIEINSKEGDVTISSTSRTQDPLAIWQAKDIVTAVGRGFSPQKAFSLLNEEIMLEVIDLMIFCGKSKNKLLRLKGRIIGEKGKTRRMIEEMTEAYISVFGHTVAIIGKQISLETAKKAIMMLIKGSQHSSVYKYVSRKRNKIKKSKFSIWKPFQLEEEE
ncbi:MAG: RNA-processing protein [Candidatus Helarchaeota archaeon]|nr:RNA-processing protein [Candidatus Helarchaeota archaeon]